MRSSGPDGRGREEAATDHDFGPRVQVLLAPATLEARGAALDALLGSALPEAFGGHTVRFADQDRRGGQVRHQVEVTTAPALLRRALGFDPSAGIELTDWLITPSQQLLCVTAGAVFHDGLGELTAARRALAWYPTDVWRYLLAVQWTRVSQEEAFVGRAGALGDELGSAVIAARLTRDLMRLACLIERRYAPYSKWLGSAFAGLTCAPVVGPCLRDVMGAAGWRDREAALCTAAEHLGHASNRLGLCAPVDPSPRRFHTRDIRVSGASHLSSALVASIRDRTVAELARRTGLLGAIDQFADSSDLLGDPSRARRLAAAWVTGGSEPS